MEQLLLQGDLQNTLGMRKELSSNKKSMVIIYSTYSDHQSVM
jgi:hypothetical protein